MSNRFANEVSGSRTADGRQLAAPLVKDEEFEICAHGACDVTSRRSS